MILLLSYKAAHGLTRPSPGSRSSEEFAMGLKEPVGYSTIWIGELLTTLDRRGLRYYVMLLPFPPLSPACFGTLYLIFSLRLGSLGLWVEEEKKESFSKLSLSLRLSDHDKKSR